MSQTLSDEPVRSPAGPAPASSSAPAAGVPRTGRAPSTSRQDLEQICLDLFEQQGFETTSIEDIATAAGISRRTFFRYFPSKNDAVWGEFDKALGQFEAWFKRCPDDVPLMTAIRRAVIEFNTFDPANSQSHRSRMSLILNTTALQAHSTLRYGEWRHIIARFAALRMACPADELTPRVIGHLALAASLAAYEQWLTEADSDLMSHLDATLSVLENSSLLEVSGANRIQNC